jgi:microcystin-dependent protein
MSTPFVAQIQIFPYTFAPRGWAFCNGQILSIAQNTALFSLLGTNFGGDGRANFGLPNLQGSVPIHQGQGPGLSLYDVGEIGGVASVTVSQAQMPAHAHQPSGTAILGTVSSPGSTANALFAEPPGSARKPGSLYGPADGTTTLASSAVTAVGGGQPHNNLQPYLTLNFCIALQGVFPARN